MTHHRPCAMHLAAGETVTGRAEPLYDPLTGHRIPIDLCGEHRRILVRMVGGYRALLEEFTPEVDPELICHCGFVARTRQGLSNHETSEHPDPDGQKCPDCGEPTTNLKTHKWREHPDGEDAEALDQLEARTRTYEECDLCTAGPFVGAVAYTNHLVGVPPPAAPRCPLGCDVATLMPDRHVRHKHGIRAFRRWVSAGRPGQQRVRVPA